MESNLNSDQTVHSREPKSRMIGIDLLKVLSIIFIILHHVSKCGGFFESSSGFERFVFSIANGLFMPSVNVFVFASAYLIIKKGRWSIKNLIKIYAQAVFYTLLAYTLICLMNYEQFSISKLLKSFSPISHVVYWFVKAYLIMYILSPLLLKIVNNLNKKEYTITLITIIVALLYSRINNYFEIFPTESGFNAIWFCVIFLFAGYQVKFGFHLKKIWWICIFAISTLIIICKIYCSIAIKVDYTYMYVFIQSISIFNILYDINIKNRFVQKCLSYLATCTFGIYLLHDGAYIQPYLYANVFKTHQYLNSRFMICYFALFCATIFICGVIVETLRKLFVKYINKFIVLISSKKKMNINDIQ